MGNYHANEFSDDFSSIEKGKNNDQSSTTAVWCHLQEGILRARNF